MGLSFPKVNRKWLGPKQYFSLRVMCFLVSTLSDSHLGLQGGKKRLPIWHILPKASPETRILLHLSQPINFPAPRTSLLRDFIPADSFRPRDFEQNQLKASHATGWPGTNNFSWQSGVRCRDCWRSQKLVLQHVTRTDNDPSWVQVSYGASETSRLVKDMSKDVQIGADEKEQSSRCENGCMRTVYTCV